MMNMIALSLLLTFFLVTHSTTSFDFGSGKAGADWQVINDGVMGGLSQGRVQFTDNSLKFSGTISLDNYGGFASIKSPFKPVNLAEAEVVEIQYKSSGQQVAITLENSRAFYKPYYKLYLEDTKGEWATTKIDIQQFKEYRLSDLTGRPVSTAILATIQRIGFVSGNKIEGDFTFEVNYMKFR